MTNRMSSTDTVELEIAREELRNEVKKAEMLEALQGDERFIKVIMEGFIEDVVKYESDNLISPNELVREAALNKIKSAKYLKAYMQYVQDCGNAARIELAGGYDND